MYSVCHSGFRSLFGPSSRGKGYGKGTVCSQYTRRHPTTGSFLSLTVSNLLFIVLSDRYFSFGFGFGFGSYFLYLDTCSKPGYRESAVNQAAPWLGAVLCICKFAGGGILGGLSEKHKKTRKIKIARKGSCGLPKLLSLMLDAVGMVRR